MKYIQFKSLELKNFKCHQYKKIEFNDGLVLLTGNNGAGKTSLFSALVWALYGRTLEGQVGDDVIRKRAGKDCYVKVEWKEGENEYRVEAYRKDKQNNNNRLVYMNNKDITPGTQAEVLQLIETLIMPRDIFINCLVFAGSRESFIDLTPQEKSVILSKILGLDKYDMYRDNINNLMSDIEQQRIKINQDQLLIQQKKESITNNITELETEIESAKSDMQSFESTTITKKNELNIQIEDLKSQLLRFDEIESAYKEAETNVINVKNEMNTIILEKKNEIDNITNNIIIDKSKLKSAIDSEYTQKLSNVNSQLENIKHNKQLLESEYKSKINDITLKFNSTINDINNNITKLNMDKQLLISKLDTKLLDNNISKLEKEKATITDKIKHIESDLNSPVPICNLCKRPITDKTEIEKELNNLKINIEHIDSEINELLIKKQSDIDSLKTQSSELDSQIIELKQKLLDINKELETARSNLKSEFESKLNELDKDYNKYLTELESIKSEYNNKLNQLDIDFKSKQTELMNTIESKYESIFSELSKKVVKYTEYRNSIKLDYDQLVARKEQLIKLESDIRKLDELLVQFNSEKQKLILLKSNKLSALLEELKDIEKIDLTDSINQLNRKENILEFWKKAFSDSGIKSMLLDDSIPVLNIKAKELCEDLYGTIKINFDSISTTKSGDLRNKFFVNVLQTVNLSNAKELSTGEKRLADLIILLSLRHLLETSYNTEFNILLLDEMLDSLDADNSNLVMNMLTKLSAQKCIILITHTLREVGIDEYAQTLML